jgi:hypothetical protein
MLPEGIAMTLIQTAKLNGVDPMAWLTDVLKRVVSGRTKANELHTLLPWTWAASRETPAIPWQRNRGSQLPH